jgi:methyl acetate hydrolase
VLLIDVARSDNRVEDREGGVIERALARRFGLAQSEVTGLIKAAEEGALQATDLFHFTRVVVNNFSNEERIGVIEMLWEVAYADDIASSSLVPPFRVPARDSPTCRGHNSRSAERAMLTMASKERREAMTQVAQIDQVLRSAIDHGDVPGVVAMAGTRDGVAYQGAFGRRALPDGDPVSTDTVFWIASMTKAITSSAAMQLVEQGKLALDQPIANVLPELSTPQVLEGFDGSGEPILRSARRPITLRHLITHTAGFVYDIWNADMGRYMETKGIPGIITCENAALALPLVFDPGDKWDYGINIDWVGKAVERVSGQRLGDYLAENLFGPIGMKTTGFKLTDEHRTRLAGMHARDEAGTLARMEFELPQEPEFQMGGGGLYGTASDYLAFQRVFLNDGRANGRSVLKPETVRFMSENAISDLNVRLLKTAVPHLSHDAEFFPGMVKKWSLGFMISTDAVPAGRSAGSLAWAGLGNTYFWIDPAKGIAGVILMQLLPFADPKALALLDAFERATYAALS